MGGGGDSKIRESRNMLLELFKIFDTKSVFQGFEGLPNIMLYTMKFVILINCTVIRDQTLFMAGVGRFALYRSNKTVFKSAR